MSTHGGPGRASEQLDDDWGRVPGLRPPLSPAAPGAWFAVLALVLTVVVVLLVRPPGPLDQPRPADQRDGLLLDGPVVAAQVEGVRFGGRTVVLLFERALPDPATLRPWLDQIPRDVEVVVVVPRSDAASAGATVVVDPDGELAAAVGLPTPVDGGPGIGYAVVDSTRKVRYSTLDPVYLENAFEVATIVGAVP